MNDFFSSIFLENPISRYLWVSLAIVAAFLFKRVLARYIAGIIYRTFWKKDLRLKKQEFLGLVQVPLQRFLLVVIVIAALEKLQYPQETYEWYGITIVPDFYIFNISFHHVLEVAGVVVVILTFIWLLLRIIDFVALLLEQRADLTPDQGDNQLIVFFKDFFKVVLVLIGVLLVMRFGFKMPIGNLITGLSLVGAALALATKESLENLIASFIIFFDKPFSTGDLVKVQQINGIVEKIGLRSTRIRTEQKTFVTVPNKQMVDSVMDNLSMRSQRRGWIQLEILATTPVERIHDLMLQVKEILKSKRERIDGFQVHLSDIQRNAMILEVEYFTPPVAVELFNQLRQEVNLSVVTKLQEMGIQLAYREGK
jgi:MscS family membrane protein